MQRPTRQCTHRGWIIFTSCWAEIPADWKPGEPSQYCASGFAEISPAAGSDAFLLSNPGHIILPDELVFFDNFELGHTAIQQALQAKINELKSQ